MKYIFLVKSLTIMIHMLERQKNRKFLSSKYPVSDKRVNEADEKPQALEAEKKELPPNVFSFPVSGIPQEERKQA